MLARLESVNRDKAVAAVRGEYVHHLDVLKLKQLLIIGEDFCFGYAVFLCRLLGSFGDYVAECDHPYVRKLFKRGEMLAVGYSSAADNSDVYYPIRHNLFSPFLGLYCLLFDIAVIFVICHDGAVTADGSVVTADNNAVKREQLPDRQTCYLAAEEGFSVAYYLEQAVLHAEKARFAYNGVGSVVSALEHTADQLVADSVGHIRLELGTVGITWRFVPA